MHDENTYWYRQHFVNALIEQGVLHSPMLKQAFFVVPRDAFIDYYFEQEGTSLVWTRIEAPGTNASKEQKDLWYRTIYSDRALVTHIDEQGRPISSSSMPSVMAMMIEALSVERGRRLLEIGTGTGYNAALLALVAGENHLVTTIEIDPVLASNAKRRLDHMMGPGINVIAELIQNNRQPLFYDNKIAIPGTSESMEPAPCGHRCMTAINNGSKQTAQSGITIACI